MIITTRFEKHKPTTSGYSISLVTTYTSTRKEKIEEVEKMFRERIGSILITEVPDKEDDNAE